MLSGSAGRLHSLMLHDTGADLQTLEEKCGSLKGKRLAYCGDIRPTSA